MQEFVNLDEGVLPDPIKVEINGHHVWLDPRRYSVAVEMRTNRVFAQERKYTAEIVDLQRAAETKREDAQALLRGAQFAVDGLRELPDDQIAGRQNEIDEEIARANTLFEEAEADEKAAVDTQDRSRRMVAEHLETIIHPKGLPEDQQLNPGWNPDVICERLSIQAMGRVIDFFVGWAPRLRGRTPKHLGGDMADSETTPPTPEPQSPAPAPQTTKRAKREPVGAAS